jgi:RNA polymerase sigma factor (sigma-70 family)
MIPSADQSAWEGFLKGDRQAFARLYREHIHQLIAYGMRISSEQHVVKDAIQDLFVELWRSRASLSPVRSVKSYLLKSLRYKLLRNSKVRTRYYSDLPEQADPQNIETNMLAAEEETGQREKVRRAISRLPARQQEVINLRFFHACSTEEAAEIMSVNYQSATNLLHRAIVHLRQYLDGGALTGISLFFDFFLNR